jgi:hypothetical protein
MAQKQPQKPSILYLLISPQSKKSLRNRILTVTSPWQKPFDVTADDNFAEKNSAPYEELPDRSAEVQYTSSRDAEAVSLHFHASKCPPSSTLDSKPPDIRRQKRNSLLLLQSCTPLILQTNDEPPSGRLQSLNLQTITPILSISETTDPDACWTIKTPRGTIKASKLVIATNAYTAGIAPQYTNCIRPPSPSSHFALAATYALFGPRNQVDYLISRPDYSFIVGSAPFTFAHDRAHWYNCADDSSLIVPAKNYFDGYMQRHFLY